MTNQVKRPARLELGDMPRDATRALGGVRQALCASFNYCRSYPKKMALLKEVLKYTHSRILAWEKEQAKAEEEAAKIYIEQMGRQAGIELDRRKSSEDMRKDYEVFLVKSEEEKAKFKEKEAKAKSEAIKEQELAQAKAKLAAAEQAVAELSPKAK